jgi:outer membrane protein OmpA-like peptidoglycan-associated protein/tetratricopeptide (TPR) repeat protein
MKAKLFNSILFLLLILFINESLIGQGVRVFSPDDFVTNRSQARLIKKARKQMSLANYHDAKDYYHELLDENPNHPDLLFETGLAYYNSKIHKERAAGFFKDALDNSVGDTIPELIYYLARSLHYNSDFKEAKFYYNRFNKLISDSRFGSALARDVTRYIEMCDYGIKYTESKNDEIIIENLGENINTIYPEYAPIFTSDGDMMIFTSRKEGSTGGKFFHDNMFYEDIYIAFRDDDGDWKKANNIDSAKIFFNAKINTKRHDAAISFSKDETKLFIYRDNDIWVSEKDKDGKWGEPERLNTNINTKSHEPSAYLSPDEETLYFVSNREGGFGGRDIYISRKQDDGSWGEAENMGPNINTPYDEDAPFITMDGNTMYFSSKGHSSMGGYDVFKSVKDKDGNWSLAENLGAAINSAGDDIFYKPDEAGELAYYSSSRPNGFGDMDIYKVFFECKDIPNTEIRGLVVSQEGMTPARVQFTVVDLKTEKVAGVFYSDPTTGRYLISIPPNRDYKLVIEGEKFRRQEINFTLPKQCKPFNLYHEISMEFLYDDEDPDKVIGQVSNVTEAFFNVDEAIKEFYGITEITDDINIELLRIGDITSRLMHNDETPAVNTRAYLVNAKNEIIRVTETDNNGYYRFKNVIRGENYSVLLDENDLVKSYYGGLVDEKSKSVIVKSTMLYNDSKNSPVEGMKVYMVDEGKKIVNFTITDKSGYYELDNISQDEAAIAKLNEEMFFTYSSDMKEKDIVFSQFTRDLGDEFENVRIFSDTLMFLEDEVSQVVDAVKETKTQDKVAEKPKVVNFENILFDFNMFTLRNESRTNLDKVYAYMKEFESVTIELHGHTDFIGAESYNMKLSENRAKVAFDYLTKKGIDKKRIKMKWFGEEKPVAANINPDGSDNPEGRQLNRRTEIKVKINE